MHLSTLIGAALGLLGCACLYLSSANQRWCARPWPAIPARTAALVLLMASGLVLASDMQKLTAIFVLLTLVMLALALFPYLGTLRANNHGK